MASYRHQSRVAVMQALFSIRLHSTQKNAKEVLHYCLAEHTPEVSDFTFAETLFDGVFSNRDAIDALILERAPQFPLEKFDPIALSILEIAVFELRFAAEQTPAPVILNEAIEIAKSFSDDALGKFINGVLSAIAHISPKNV